VEGLDDGGELQRPLPSERTMTSPLPQDMAAPVVKLCTASDDFFGSSTTHDMCCICYKKHRSVGGSGASAAATTSRPVVRSACDPVAAVPIAERLLAGFGN